MVIYYKRKLEKWLKVALKQFPACLITGARQTGKSTLLKNFLKNYTYLSLDDLFLRKMAIDDPKSFLEIHKSPLIIDEIQYAPNLLSYIKIKIDEDRQNYGRFVLTGSQVFQLMKGVSESLAGRIAIFNLYPFSFEEIPIKKTLIFDIKYTYKRMLEGFFPEFFVKTSIDKTLWYGSYIKTYIERDIRNIKSVSSLSKFQNFIEILATRAGQVLNLSTISNECDISQPTCKSWLSLLESTYIIYLLRPFYKNHKKRLVKSPKIYFLDTGLLCYLLGIDSVNRLLRSKEKGAIFENMVIMEVVKKISYENKRILLSFYRTQNKREIDLIIEKDLKVIPYEIKFTKTLSTKMVSSLKFFQKEYNAKVGYLVNLNEKDMVLSENIKAIHFSKI